MQQIFTAAVGEQRMDSPLGPLSVGQRGEGLGWILPLPENRAAFTSLAPTPFTARACRELMAYFAGRRQRFDLPCNPAGSDFDRRVWQALAKVPFGERVTYGALAAALGQPTAARAVGGAVGRNPLLVVCPCHRVVAKSGLGGFSAGLWRKRWLLRHEGSL